MKCWIIWIVSLCVYQHLLINMRIFEGLVGPCNREFSQYIWISDTPLFLSLPCQENRQGVPVCFLDMVNPALALSIDLSACLIQKPGSVKTGLTASVTSVQYCGGYHQYIQGCPVLWEEGIASILKKVEKLKNIFTLFQNWCLALAYSHLYGHLVIRATFFILNIQSLVRIPL